MIDKREIIDAATALGLNPHVVEKDYVLGWVLWGIYGHGALAESWIFKGGTCLKKCFFETYRVSEDLDFTLTDPSHIDADFLKTVFSDIGERIYEEAGIELPPEFQQFEIYETPRGRESCQGRLGYQGPVSPRGKNMPRIKLDLSADECVVLPPMQELPAKRSSMSVLCACPYLARPGPISRSFVLPHPTGFAWTLTIWDQRDVSNPTRFAAPLKAI